MTQPAPIIPAEETTAAETTEYLETTVQADGTEKAPEAVPSDIQTAAQKVKSSASSGTGISSGSSFVVTKETVPSATVQTTATTIASTTQTGTQQAEYSDSNTDILSGYRIRLMMEQSGGVAKFSKNGVTITIAQNAISFEDTDWITVSIVPVKDDTAYDIRILVNDAAVDIKNPMTIWFPETCFPDNGTPALEIDGSVQLLEYDEDSCAYRMKTTFLGTFSLIAEDTAADEMPEKSYWLRNLFLILGISLAVIGGLFFIIRYFRRKDN